RYHMLLSVLARDSALGTVAVTFTAKRSTDVILDFRGPRVSDVRVNGAPAQVTFNGSHLLIPARAIHAGRNEGQASFTARIAPAGASIIRFHDDRDDGDYLYTLFVPSDANGLFPCFDQPDLKARLALSLTVPKGWRALANGVTEKVDTSGASLTYNFRETD